MPSNIEQKQKALDAFKDWSNYLLVTTVAALGWTTAKDGAAFSSPWIKIACIHLFALSIVFAILTLALIPHVSEDLEEWDDSIYRVRWEGWFGGSYGLKDFCLPQHVFFLLGIVTYAGGTAFPTCVCASLRAIGIAVIGLLLVLGVMVLALWRHRSAPKPKRPRAAKSAPSL